VALMEWLRNLAIHRKVMIITMMTSGVALLVAGMAFLAYENVAFRAAALADLEATAAMVGESSAAALTFGDADSAAQTLRTLSVHPEVVGAAIYGTDGVLFASYRRYSGWAPERIELKAANESRFSGGALYLSHSITVRGERVGTVLIESDLSQMHARITRYLVLMIVVIASASGIAWLLARKLQTTISEPVRHLADVVATVTAEQDYSVRAVRTGTDELGQLIDGFNLMLSQIQSQDAALQEARDRLERRVEERTLALQAEVVERTQAQAEIERIHRQLVASSRQAGMAEIATNVLHNVGNVLNSVNVSAILASDLARRSPAAGLGRVVELMRTHAGDLGAFVSEDPRGRHLIPHLGNLAQQLADEQTRIVSELDSLRSNIEHIKDIVSMQQSYAKVAGVSEIVAVADLVEDGLRMNAGALSRHNVEVVRDLQCEPTVNVDKHKVLQILVNLIRNAKYACEESGRLDRRVTLRVTRDAGRVYIAVCDNGVGIVPENLTRIFSHGFTTRASGHGFGLHSGALAAKELGGSLTVHSDGAGKGAVFTLELAEHRLAPAHQEVA
jgi:two-component system, NtrC family, sensor kinase